MRVSVLLLLLLSVWLMVSVTAMEVEVEEEGNPLTLTQTAPLTTDSSPLLPPSVNQAGILTVTEANPPYASATSAVKKSKKKQPKAKYTPGVDVLGSAVGVPLNPTEHLKADLEKDRLYVASVLRSPLDLGDPTDCKHSDIVRDEKELRRIALRINHRRISLAQQQHWIDHATKALRKIEGEVSQTTSTARSLAEQLDALEAQKEDITNHVRRKLELKELDRTTSNLMRLKNARLKEEVRLQKKHNKFAIQNWEHNQVLDKLNKMRTEQGLALGQLYDPKPYRFQQVEGEQEQEQQSESEQESEQDQEDYVESDQEAESEISSEAEQAADEAANGEAGAEVEQEGEAQTESEGETEAESEQESEESGENQSEAEDSE